jgi:diacylglycerol kinase family enzyme
VLNGFYDEKGKRISKAVFGVIYTGTSPDFCRSYGIPTDTAAAVRVIIGGMKRGISIGRIEFENVPDAANKPDASNEHIIKADTVKKVQYFACCANVGMGADLANYANSGIRRVCGDRLGTFIAMIRTLFTYKPIDIEINGHRIERLYNMFVGKTFYIASGLKVANELEHNSKTDMFYVLPIRGKLISSILKLYRGKPMSVTYESRIEIKGDGKVEFDGDEGGVLPCVISNAEILDILC